MNQSTRITLCLFVLLVLSGLTFFAVTGTAQDEPPADEPAEVQEDNGLIEVSEDGAQLDPPVQADQIPVGAWFCDMGTVHYASLSEGDGSCPVCGMFLKQKADPETQPAETGHEGHGH